MGQGKHFILEGDEYDTAFFDKGPKFLHYFPDSVILTSVEFDHADIYKDLDAVETAFKRLVNLMPRRGTNCGLRHRARAWSVAWQGILSGGTVRRCEQSELACNQFAAGTYADDVVCGRRRRILGGI